MKLPFKAPFALRKAQYRRLVGALVVLFLVVGGILWRWNGAKPPAMATPAVTLNIADSTVHASPVDIVLARTEQALREQKATSDALKQQVQQLVAREALAPTDEDKQQMAQVQARLTALEQQLKTQASQSAGGVADDGSPLPVLPLPQAKATDRQAPALLQSEDVPLTPVAGLDARHYVPAGTFVKAVLLSGLDAGAGVTSQAQPRPVLLRLLDNGVLPQQGQSPLRDCVVTAAAYGDISSERAYIRLERMSCEREGQLTDIPVYGYVAGSDGKAGVRGRPVWREGTLVKRSFFAGLFASIGQGVLSAFNPTVATSLTHQAKDNAWEVAKQGITGGASHALTKLADYEIQRAEQYQPVIQVSAGTSVDVIFHTGFYLAGKPVQPPPVQEAPAATMPEQ